MKRKICVAAAAFASSLFLTACGSKEYLKDIKAEKYVTLGTYTGIEATVNKLEVPEGAVDSYIYDNYLAPKAEKVPVTGRAVQEGDVANIDFVGYHDDVAFEGGTGADFDLTIGSGRFIEGFEEGLIGANIGDTRSLNLTFPDPYTNPELAGEDVVFEVTVNSISESKAPALTDALVKQLGEEGYNVGGAQTAQELNDYVYNLYDQSVQSTYDNEIETAMASTIMENSTFREPPEEMVQRFITSIENNMSIRRPLSVCPSRSICSFTKDLTKQDIGRFLTKRACGWQSSISCTRQLQTKRGLCRQRRRLPVKFPR